MIHAMVPLGYVDPMSGAIVLQLLIAGFVGTAAFFRRSIFGGIAKLFGRSPKSEDTPADDGQTDETQD